MPPPTRRTTVDSATLLAIGGAALVLAPALWILRGGSPAELAPP